MRKFRLLGALAVSAIGLTYAGPAWAGTGVSGKPTTKPHPITASGFDPKSVTIGGGASVLPTTRTVPHWYGTTTNPQNGVTYGYNMAGSNPNTCSGSACSVTIQADIIKQKLPENNGGFKALNTGGSSYGKLDERIYTELTSDHPIDLCRYQVINNYMGRAGLINSGGESRGAADLKEAVRTAVINKRAGGMGLISGRKSFQRPMKEGVELLHAIQDVYLNQAVTIA